MLVKLSFAVVVGSILAFFAMGYHWPLTIVPIAVLPCVYFKAYRGFYAILLLAYIGFYTSAQVALKQSLPLTLDKHTALISVHLLAFPQRGKAHSATKLTVALNQQLQLNNFILPAGSRIRLSDYANLPIAPGQNWQIQVVLRSPRGLVNPAGFDYRRWLLSERIVATGYIIANEYNQQQATKPSSWLLQRYRLAQKLDAILVDKPSRALIKALVLGDSSGFSREHRQVFAQTGIAHLFVISGLHIGLIAALAWFIARWACVLCWHPMRYGYALRIQAGSALLAAFTYAALAGFALPTVRAVFMVGLVLLATFYRRYYRPMHILLIAAAIIVLNEPLVILGLSFWMSFTAVAVLLYAWHSERRWQALILSQLSIFLAMNLLLSLFDIAIAPLSPLVNVVAIPIVSFVLVPLCLGASALVLVSIEAPILIVQAIFDGVWQVLLALSQFTYAQLNLSPTMPALIVAALGLYIGFRYRRYWYFAVLTQLPIYSQLPREPDNLQITVFDVGQGLAVLIRHGSYSLLYDTGASYPSGFSMAEAVLSPSLYRLGVRSLDTLVISHGDNDHAGGARVISDAFKPINYYAPAKYSASHEHYKNCAEAKAIKHERLNIDFFSASLIAASKNNNSCVLRISYGKFSMLLSGDIEKLAEFTLLNQGLAETELLMVPHHGSRTSSSDALLAAVKPRLALVSAGFNNRFSHPHPEITERYQRQSIPLLNTAYTGAIDIHIDENGAIESIHLAREEKYGFWH